MRKALINLPSHYLRCGTLGSLLLKLDQVRAVDLLLVRLDVFVWTDAP